MRTQVSLEAVGALAEGRHEKPFDVLGPHEVVDQGRRALAVRAFRPDSKQMWLVDPAQGSSQPMRRIHPSGLYEAICPIEDGDLGKQAKVGDYMIRVSDAHGGRQTMHDPYASQPLLTDYDLHLLHEGTHYDAYERMGAHQREVDGVKGVNFAVWAPNAEGISVIGDFNDWSRATHPMQKRASSGTWELFIPGIDVGALYKFAVKQLGGAVVEKCDPYAFAAEVPPLTANIVTDLSRHEWADGEWMDNRIESNGLDAPMSIYELHLGSWRRDPADPDRWLSYSEIAPQLVEYCQKMGYTHVELMPVSEHPLTASWGYQTVGYFAATSRYGSPEDLMAFIDALHQASIGVIIDWVPAHFPKDEHGLSRFDGSALYEHEDPRQGEHPDWGTLIFNYGRSEVAGFLLANALFWCDKYHIDGLRVDAVASMLYLDYSREADEWVPNKHGGRENLEAIEFVKTFNEKVHERHPGVLTIAEESTAWGGVSRPIYVGGLGFSLKWNMGWMNDTLSYMEEDPIHRQFHQDKMTFGIHYSFSENFVLPISHDEVVHGKGSMIEKMPGNTWEKFANLRAYYAFMWTHPGKKLMFMGCEFAQPEEWNHNGELNWTVASEPPHRGVQKLVQDLNGLYCNTPALHVKDCMPEGFAWLSKDAAQSTLSYVRYGADGDAPIVIMCNFTPVERLDFRLGVPEAGFWEEALNTDAAIYGGENRGNIGGQSTTDIAIDGHQQSLTLTLPPLSVVILKPRRTQ